MLELRPTTLREANAHVLAHHRHHKPPRGHKFSIGVQNDSGLVGVVIVGRPIAQGLQDGWTAEALRNCTNGTRNACSMLYGAAARASAAMGYRKIVTYIRADELGTSLKAAGWHFEAMVKGRSWDCPSRPRTDKTEIIDRQRWAKILVKDYVDNHDGERGGLWNTLGSSGEET